MLTICCLCFSLNSTSCGTALWNGKFISLSLLYFVKAFYTFNHDLLVAVLSSSELSGSAFNLFHSCFHWGAQLLKVGEIYLNSRVFSSGVPQESTWGSSWFDFMFCTPQFDMVNTKCNVMPDEKKSTKNKCSLNGNLLVIFNIRLKFIEHVPRWLREIFRIFFFLTALQKY